MKLRLTTILVTLLAAAALSKPAFANEQVCHKTGNGTFHLISIAPDALSAHIAHGDGKPGDPVPDMSGFIFGPNCTPTVAPPPGLPVGCYTLSVNGFTVDLFYFGPIDILGNINQFGSTDGTCSGPAILVLKAGLIAADNVTEAESKCDELTASTSVILFDLGAPGAFLPSEPGFWFCTAGPGK
jgi:hypothetical protein